MVLARPDADADILTVNATTRGVCDGFSLRQAHDDLEDMLKRR